MTPIAATSAAEPKKGTCFWIWNHEWGKWEDESHGDITVRYGSDPKPFTVGRWLRQERRCARCNMADIRMTQATVRGAAL